MDDKQVTGGLKQAGGKIKEVTGDLVGNERMEAEGKVDQMEGKTEKNAGKIKDAVKDQLR